MQIGFIGLGNLGTPIAENLLAKHKGMLVYNRTASKAEPFADNGATICTSGATLAQQSDIVFTMVADDAALNTITKGAGGIAANLKEGGIHISMSTILPATATDLAGLHAAHGSQYIAAPVMGRPEAAKAQKLNFLVSGQAVTVTEIKPLLQDAGAAGIWEFGTEVAAANVAKLCSNFLIIAAIESMAEGINLAAKSGIDAGAWMHMLTQTIFAAPIYNNYGNIILKEQYQPASFTLRLGLKDVKLVNRQAADYHASMPVGNLLQQRLEEGMDKGLGEYDWTAIAKILQ